jgi:hypothetical protein
MKEIEVEKNSAPPNPKAMEKEKELNQEMIEIRNERDTEEERRSTEEENRRNR